MTETNAEQKPRVITLPDDERNRGKVVVFNDVEFTEFEYETVSINPDLLQEEYATVSKALAFFNIRRVDRERDVEQSKADRDSAKVRLDTEKARADMDVRGTWNTETMGKLTDASVSARVSSHDFVIKAQSALEKAADKIIVCNFAAGRAAGITEAVRAKRDMLISLGADLRAERLGDPSIRNQPQSRSMPVQPSHRSGG